MTTTDPLPTLPNILAGLLSQADSNRGSTQHHKFPNGLTVSLLISPHGAIHRLQIYRLDRAPTMDEWNTIQDDLPYTLNQRPENMSRGGLHVLQATFICWNCKCGAYRPVNGAGFVPGCKKCGAEAYVYEEERVLLYERSN